MALSTPSLASHHALYSQVRDSIRSGDLLAWRITRMTSIFDFFLILYQKLFRAKFSHLALAVWVGNRLFAVEATPDKVRMIPLSMLDNFYLIPADVPSRKEYFEMIARHLGKPYGLLDLLKVILGFRGSDTSLYCSELALHYYNEVGYFSVDIDEFDDHIPTPDDVVERVLAQAKSTITFVRIDQGNLNVL